jgi:hypothetical protein
VGDAGSHFGQPCLTSADCQDPSLTCPRDPNPANVDPPATCTETCVLTGDCFHINIDWYCCKKDPWPDHACVGADYHPDKTFCDIP